MGYGFGSADESTGGLESGAGLMPQYARDRLAQSANAAQGSAEGESTAQAVGGALGAVIGTYFGGNTAMGWKIGSQAGGDVYGVGSGRKPASEAFVNSVTSGIDVFNKGKKNKNSYTEGGAEPPTELGESTDMGLGGM